MPHRILDMSDMLGIPLEESDSFIQDLAQMLRKVFTVRPSEHVLK